MLFLPGTYISVRSLRGMMSYTHADGSQALFSMSFFHFAPGVEGEAEQWTVSSRFWLYWVVTIPATALTVGMWFLFQRRHSPSTDSAARSLDSAIVDSQGHGYKTKSHTV
jgi:hypothetical protein